MKTQSSKATGLKKGVDITKAKKDLNVMNIKTLQESNPGDELKREILGPFKDLNQSKLVKCMKEYFGKQIIPLALVGHFLNYVGNNLLHHIFQLFTN